MLPVTTHTQAAFVPKATESARRQRAKGVGNALAIRIGRRTFESQSHAMRELHLAHKTVEKMIARGEAEYV